MKTILGAFISAILLAASGSLAEQTELHILADSSPSEISDKAMLGRAEVLKGRINEIHAGQTALSLTIHRGASRELGNAKSYWGGLLDLGADPTIGEPSAFRVAANFKVTRFFNVAFDKGRPLARRQAYLDFCETQIKSNPAMTSFFAIGEPLWILRDARHQIAAEIATIETEKKWKEAEMAWAWANAAAFRGSSSMTGSIPSLEALAAQINKQNLDGETVFLHAIVRHIPLASRPSLRENPPYVPELDLDFLNVLLLAGADPAFQEFGRKSPLVMVAEAGLIPVLDLVFKDVTVERENGLLDHLLSKGPVQAKIVPDPKHAEYVKWLSTKFDRQLKARAITILPFAERSGSSSAASTSSSSSFSPPPKPSSSSSPSSLSSSSGAGAPPAPYSSKNNPKRADPWAEKK